MRLPLSIGLAISIISCATGQRSYTVDYIDRTPQQQPNTEVANQPSISNIASEDSGSDEESLYEKGLNHIDHPTVQKWIEYFTKKHPERFQRFLQRGHYYRSFIESQLTENGLPKELYYLAMIESGFVTSAKSHASAVGIWQFVSATANRYGLKVIHGLDERTNPILATDAAIRYLADLHRVYQSWWLAFAGYNSGEHRVLRAIMAHNSRDYFTLLDKKALPQETRNYVPKFIAAMYLGENAAKFGFKIEDKTQLEFDGLSAVPIGAGIALDQFARVSKCKAGDLLEFNRHFQRTNYFHRTSTTLLLPEHCLVSKSTMTALEKSGEKRVNRSIKALAYHKVRRGESLFAIAKKYGTTVSHLKKINSLRSNRIYPGKKLKLQQTIATYKVQSGDSLYLIAKKYRTSVAAIKKINNMRHTRIYPGQVIRLSYL